jgi:hypothetical protein
MEECGVLDDVALFCQCETPRVHDRIDVVDRLNVPIGKRLIDERPQVLGPL